MYSLHVHKCHKGEGDDAKQTAYGNNQRNPKKQAKQLACHSNLCATETESGFSLSPIEPIIPNSAVQRCLHHGEDDCTSKDLPCTLPVVVPSLTAPSTPRPLMPSPLSMVPPPEKTDDQGGYDHGVLG